MDAGFEAASNRPLINALLRNISPAKAVLEQSRSSSFGEEDLSRPKFKQPAASIEDTSDSATEWISLTLERLASRGLLPQMFQSAGGGNVGRSESAGGNGSASKSSRSSSMTVTPEQVVLISCIRQAVDDYHLALTPTGESGEFWTSSIEYLGKVSGYDSHDKSPSIVG